MDETGVQCTHRKLLNQSQVTDNLYPLSHNVVSSTLPVVIFKGHWCKIRFIFQCKLVRDNPPLYIRGRRDYSHLVVQIVQTHGNLLVLDQHLLQNQMMAKRVQALVAIQ
jgi:hypothetical protein